MPEILRKPPSQIKIRTLETDVEDMRKSGGGLVEGKILGRSLEELTSSIEQKKKGEVTFFPTRVAPEEITQKKKKVPIIIIATIVGIGLVIGLVFYTGHKPQSPSNTLPPAAQPQYISLLHNYNGPQESVTFDLTLKNFESILVKQFYTITVPETVKEIIFTKNNGELVTGEEFLKTLFNNFEGIPFSNQPKWSKSFSFIIYTSKNGTNSIAYVAQMDNSSLNVTAFSSLKSRFAIDFEKFIINNVKLLTSQYLQDPGKPNAQFLPQTIGAINASVLQFSTGAEFYYALYDNYFIAGTSKDAFTKILDLIITR